VNIDIEQIERLMRALKENDFHEVEIRHGEERIWLRRGGQTTAPAQVAFPMATGERERATGIGESAPPAAADDQSVVTVTSPLVGTFYRAPSPQARSFVEVGSLVRKGTVLCIVEAFKLMNEIESEVDGVVSEVLIENGTPVEFGQGLVRIRRSG
jgi:acetyl-CoA carboxylase biotin carboxyl carrier protein